MKLVNHVCHKMYKFSLAMKSFIQTSLRSDGTNEKLINCRPYFLIVTAALIKLKIIIIINNNKNSKILIVFGKSWWLSVGKLFIFNNNYVLP